VAPQAILKLREWNRDRRLRWIERPVLLRDLNGAQLVICATGHSPVDRKMSLAARRRGLLVNCVSEPGLGNVIFPAVACTGIVQVAVSTGGASPALARKLAGEVSRKLGSKTARWAKLLEHLRPIVIAQVPRQQRPAVWRDLTADKLGDMVSKGRMTEARKFARMKIKEASQQIPSKRRTPSTK
jgi:siroheme synthase-like protein